MNTNNNEAIFRNKITLLSFICSLLVICRHTNNLSVYGIDNNSVGFSKIVYLIENYWFTLTQVAVPIFFIISGFLFYRNYSLDKIKTKYVSRIKSLLIPYLFWCIFYYLYFAVLSYLPQTRGLLASDDLVTLNLTSFVNCFWNNSYYTLWFLQSLMVFVLINPIIYLLLKNHSSKFPTGLIFMILLYLNYKFEFIRLVDGVEYYCFGAFIGINFKDIATTQNKKISTVCLLYISFILITCFRYFDIEMEILFYVCVWYALDLLNLNFNMPWWMSISFFTYVAHDIILEVLEKLFFIAFGSKAVFALADFVFMPLITFAILAVFANFAKNKLPIIWNTVSGYR